jgi:hypothetical protein
MQSGSRFFVYINTYARRGLIYLNHLCCPAYPNQSTEYYFAPSWSLPLPQGNANFLFLLSISRNRSENPLMTNSKEAESYCRHRQGMNQMSHNRSFQLLQACTRVIIAGHRHCYKYALVTTTGWQYCHEHESKTSMRSITGLTSYCIGSNELDEKPIHPLNNIIILREVHITPLNLS